MAYIGASPTSAAFITDQFSGTGSQTAFTMSVAPATTSSMLVSITGVLQDPSTYSINGNTLTLEPAPPAGTGNISVRYLGIPASGVVTTAYRTVTEFTATAGQTTFTPPSYTPGFINVFRNGVRLGATNFTASNGSTVVLANAASVGDLIVTESFFVSSVLNALPVSGGTINAPAGATPLVVQTNGVTGLAQDSAGRVGIRATPRAGYGNLQVYNSYIYVNEDGADTRQMYLRTSFGGVPAIQIATADPLLLVTNNTERVRIDSAGRVTMPYQPAFYAMMNNVNITSTQAIIFEDVYVNIGSHYNPANGRFTAPVAGTYHFSANFLKRSGSGRLLFHKNDVYYGSGNSQTYSGNIGSGEVSHAASIIITLVAGDYINVIAQIDSGDVYGQSNSHNGFSGFLIG